MYKEAIIYENLEEINTKMSQEFAMKYALSKEIDKLVRTIDNYGSGYQVRCQNLEDICEREIEMIE